MKYTFNLFYVIWIIAAIIIGCMGLVSWWVIGLIAMSHIELNMEWSKK